jgi:hypothetical protein
MSEDRTAGPLTTSIVTTTRTIVTATTVVTTTSIVMKRTLVRTRPRAIIVVLNDSQS